MLTSFKIKNYKCFRELDVKKLTRFNLVGGASNCGKTSLLEAIFLVFDTQDLNMFIKHLFWRGATQMHDFKTGPLLFAPSCHKFNAETPIEFLYTIDNQKKRISYQFIQRISSAQSIYAETHENNNGDIGDIGSTHNAFADLAQIKIVAGTSKEKSSEASLGIVHPKSPEAQQAQKLPHIKGTAPLIRFNNAHNLVAYSPMSVTFRLSSETGVHQSLVRTFSDIDVSQETQHILKALQIIEPRLKNLSLQATTNQGELMPYTNVDGISVQTPLALMGDGLVNLFRTLLFMSNAKNGICLIDEIENGFHHTAMDKVWQALVQYAQSQNTQIIATTHNREFILKALYSMPDEMKNDFQYMRIDHHNEQPHKVHHYDCETLETAAETNWAIR